MREAVYEPARDRRLERLVVAHTVLAQADLKGLDRHIARAFQVLAGGGAATVFWADEVGRISETGTAHDGRRRRRAPAGPLDSPGADYREGNHRSGVAPYYAMRPRTVWASLRLRLRDAVVGGVIIDGLAILDDGFHNLLSGLGAHAAALHHISGELAEAQQDARTDPLTGLGTRIVLREALSALTPGMVVMLCDVDGLKSMNDTYGHEAGDALLAGIAKALQTAVREGDALVRFGGDEFIIVGSATNAARFAERVQMAVSRTMISAGHNQIPASVSIGFAIAGADGDHPQRLLALADSRMLEVKRARKKERSA